MNRHRFWQLSLRQDSWRNCVKIFGTPHFDRARITGATAQGQMLPGNFVRLMNEPLRIGGSPRHQNAINWALPGIGGCGGCLYFMARIGNPR
jgi:hypothetical protein